MDIQPLIRNWLAIGIILLFVGTSTIPTLSYSAGDLGYEKEPACMGKVYGCVGNSHGMYTWTPYPFALVTTENKRVRCDHTGEYSMYLPLYQEYDMTAYVLGYNPLTKHVVLSDETPVIKLTFDMCGRERKDIKPLEKSTIRDTNFTSLGTVTVNVTVFGWYPDIGGWPYLLSEASVFIRVVGIRPSIMLGRNLVGRGITNFTGHCTIEIPAPLNNSFCYLIYARGFEFRPCFKFDFPAQSFQFIQLKANDTPDDIRLTLIGWG
jgi:hypothetical protein